jgi:hypothetical protein
MPLPELGDAQIAWVVQHVADYIDRQRKTHRDRSVPLNASQRAAMQPFFHSVHLGLGKSSGSE